MTIIQTPSKCYAHYQTPLTNAKIKLPIYLHIPLTHMSNVDFMRCYDYIQTKHKIQTDDKITCYPGRSFISLY